ncbi:hypothetical protein L6452_20470 [Arctium lappa]|uniref:Uncharacterized protein n=1 Tax=Arctium lappa TaxID=4217 RepID=A0ACB9BDC0_ARCLA|nr:hypothetical protein L6452_20470 [Arctium lappa]
MKIFSWVHRRFRHKDGGSLDFKKADQNEKVALLENEDDGWKEGILAIGTLGIDLFKDFNPKDDVNDQVLFFGDHEDQDHEDDQEGEMECSPLALKASNHGFDHVDDQKQDPDHEVAKPNNGQEYVIDSMDLDIDMERLKKIKKSGERITLADLFWADSENNKLYDHDHDHKVIKIPTMSTESIKKHGANDDDHGFLISKKKKKLPKDDSADHPINKTKRLMRKMLKKKKIHPDIGIQKMETAGFVYQQMDHAHAT